MTTIAKSLKRVINRFRYRLADFDALPQLTLLGIIIGCSAGILIVLFRLSIQIPLDFLLVDNNENFESLSPFWRFSLPMIGAFIIASGLHFLNDKDRQVSVGHVLERLHNFQGRMPARNLFVQFFGGAITLITGQSVGREGPAVHLGASISSLIGQWLKLPNNSLSTLIGCGVAAAISASFNTPIAGVIFAMEVVLMSYTIIGFVPIMMASVCGALISRAVFGAEVFFTVDNANLQGFIEIPFMVIAGLIIALVATLYMRLQIGFNRFNHYPIFFRILIAGLVTSLIGVFFPEILGLGYDTINLTLEGKIGVGLLSMIVVAKIVATSFSISMGMPGGLIGPQLFTGACLGGIIGYAGSTLFPESITNSSIYVLLGMAAMMGAVLNAPLAALMAVVELTYSPGLIFPSMLIIVIACVVTRELYKCDGIFVEQLNLNGTKLQSGPLQQMLGNIGVRSAMNTAFIETTNIIALPSAKDILSSNPLWIIIKTEKNNVLLRAADLALAIKTIEEKIKVNANAENDEKLTTIENLKDDVIDEEIDLLEIPAQRIDLTPLTELSSLFEAKKLLDKTPGSAVFITPQIQITPKPQILGIITSATISNYYI